MLPYELLTAAIDPTMILQALGMQADPWQRQVLLSPAKHMLLNCSRGAGKSRVTAVLALHTAIFQPRRLVLLISRSQRQSTELLRYVKEAFHALSQPLATVHSSANAIEFANGSRIIALPGKEETIRTFHGVHLLVLDEAARIPDILYGAVRPMLGISGGRTICLSTPFGQRGFFWRAWCDQGGPWQRFQVTWRECPRLSEEFLEQERRQFGDDWIAQEYECSFTSCAGLVYPEFESCIVLDSVPPTEGKWVGGIDWGFRNPFAAVWGVLDRHDVLWIFGERYMRRTALHKHTAALPKNVIWYADPSGATEIEECRAAGLIVRTANNDIRAGIQAVTARIQTGRLKVHGTKCPHLIDEARLYRYPTVGDEVASSENPVDEHNHALGALRYLISRIDARSMARMRGEKKEQKLQAHKPIDPMHDAALWR